MTKPASLGTWGASIAVAFMAATGGAWGDEASSAADSLSRLKAGNARFVADLTKAASATSAATALPRAATATPSATASATPVAPRAAVLSCSDSSVPPEIVFQTNGGELLVVRSGAHVVDRSVLATLEYAVENAHVPLLVVMGHQSCDLVRTALTTPAGASRGPNLDYLLRAIQPATARAASLPEAQRLRGAILGHVEETINQLLEQSPVIRRQADARKLSLVGAYYEPSTGRVLFSDVVEPPSSGNAVAAETH